MGREGKKKSLRVQEGAVLQLFERLAQFGGRVHHDRTLPSDRLLERAAGDQQERIGFVRIAKTEGAVQMDARALDGGLGAREAFDGSNGHGTWMPLRVRGYLPLLWNESLYNPARMDSGAFRELLAADVAVDLGVLSASEAGQALARFWESDQRNGSLLGSLDPADRSRVETELARILDAAGGDAQAAIQARGVDREIPASLAPAASHALSEAGARMRAPLRAMDKKRYVGFLPLGEGGMGVVYLALDSELNRRVAFKMIRSGATDPLAAESGPVADDTVARFMQEAVVTGGLEHPGIVPVYELGITPSGVPYYTMRLVRGERTLNDAIDGARSQQERLALLEPFLKVCDAVGYAHSRGVIHRDLKPANIALGEFGEVVVIDWGLAKMHERPDLAGSRWQSRLSELREVTDLKTLTSALGTPGYMAPEAALGEIAKIDRRADVYSLGAILHRILTGEFPFKFGSFQEYVSCLLSGLEVAPSPTGLGEICVKALAPKIEDRYATVEELAAAVRSWQSESAVDREVETLHTEAHAALEAAEGLEGDEQLRQLDRAIAVTARMLDLRPGHEQAIAMRDDARGLRTRAMAQREAGARKRLLRRVGVVGLLAASAATFVVLAVIYEKGKEAEAARARAEDLAAFMLDDLYGALVPVGRLDLLAKVARKSLDHYAALPDEDVTNDVLGKRALVLGRIAEVLQDSGDLDVAMQSARESARLYELIGDRYELSVTLNRLGDVQQESSDLDGALASYRRSAEIRKELGRASDRTRSIQRVADVLMRKGEREPAQKLYAEVLTLRRALYGKNREDTEVQMVLALILERHGDLTRSNIGESRAYFEEALALRRGLLAQARDNTDRQAKLAGCLFRVAHSQNASGEREAGAKTFREALALYRSLVMGNPMNANHQRSLALTLERLGDVGEALKVKRAVVERHPGNPRARHDLAIALLNMGNRAKAKKDWTGALDRYEEALAIVRALAREDTVNTEWIEDMGNALARVGEVYQATQRPAEAKAKFEQSLLVAERLVRKDPENGQWQRSHALALDRVGRSADSLVIRRALFKRDPDNLTWSNELAWLLGVMGDKTGDVGYYEEALPVRRAQPKTPRQQRELSYCLYSIGLMREKAGELEPARVALRDAESIHRGAKGFEEEHRWWADAYLRVSYAAACAAAKEGDRALALERLAENLAWSREHLDKKQLAEHIERVRDTDDAMASLRGSIEFDRLFR